MIVTSPQWFMIFNGKSCKQAPVYYPLKLMVYTGEEEVKVKITLPNMHTCTHMVIYLRCIIIMKYCWCCIVLVYVGQTHVPLTRVGTSAFLCRYVCVLVYKTFNIYRSVRHNQPCAVMCLYSYNAGKSTLNSTFTSVSMLEFMSSVLLPLSIFPLKIFDTGILKSVQVCTSGWQQSSMAGVWGKHSNVPLCYSSQLLFPFCAPSQSSYQRDESTYEDTQ